MKQKGLLLAGGLLLLMNVVSAQAKLVEKVTKKGSELVIPYEKYVLPNGLTLIVHEDHSDPVVHIDVTYHVGSAREEIGKSGFAHFFEHMLFQGSDNVADEQHFKIVSEAGGTLNGSTSRDRTNYYETVPSNQLEKMLWLESDRMGFFLDAVTQKKFEVQRSTVKNERGQRLDNVPYGLVSETYSKNLYPYGHPYSWEVIGYVEDLNRVDVNDLKNFFMRWYGPNNAVLTIGGDVKPAEVIKLVEEYFGSIPSGPKVEAANYPASQLDKNRYTSFTDNYARLPLLAIVYPTVPNYHKDMAALQCLAQVIGQGRNSLLYQQFVKKQQALQAASFSRMDELAGEFIFQMVPMQGKTLGDMEKLFRASLDTFERLGVSDDDIAKFRGSRESQLINGLQSVQGKVTQLAAFQTFTGNPNKIGELLRLYTSLTKEDVMAAYNRYIKNKGAVVLSVVPKGQEGVIAAANNFRIDSTQYKAPDYGYKGLAYKKPTDFDRTKMPGNGANPTVKVPPFWRKDLPNGAKVIGAVNNEIPTVTLNITIPGGHLASANDLSKAGLANLFTDMMAEDTKNYTAEQLSIELQKLGSSIGVFSGVDGITFSVQSLKKNIDQTLALLQERMYNPKFTEEAFNRLKQQTMQAFKAQKAQPAAVADAVFAKINYGPNHILGIPEEGTEETVKNITLADIQNYYTNYMTSVDAKVVIVGDMKQEEVLPKLTFLNKLPKKKITLAKVNPTPAVDKTKVFIVDVPKGAQSEFRVGYTMPLKYDATGDYYKANLANYVLGGDFNSRLNLNLREDKGWTYGARSGFSSDEHGGVFEFSSGIRADATDSALTEVMKELKNYTANGITDQELTFMKSAIGQRDALRYETGAQKAAFIGRILDYNLPANYVEQQNTILKNMTKAEIDRVTKKYVQPEKMNILLVGDKAKILDGVKKLGYEVIELDADGKKVGEKKEF
ncbi:MAG TPA: pitrilysin family protein [Flavisolibacter sp.]|nr:pitrilysin family protein [Flavisolibacter sp.]